MKRAIISITIVLLFAGQSQIWAEEQSGVSPAIYGERVYYEKLHLEKQAQEVRAKQIKAWASSGEICRVLGHKWQMGFRLSFLEFIGNFHSLDENCGGRRPTHRKCLTCGEIQERIITTTEEWR